MNPFAIRTALLFLLLAGPLFSPAAIAQEAGKPQASSPAALIGELGDADFSRKGEIATTLASSGYPRASAIINAMINDDLYATDQNRVVIESGDGTNIFTDAMTGAAVPGLNENDLNKIIANNNLRRQLRGVLASLSLLSPDPQVRRKAAIAAFDSDDEALLPAIDAALAREKVGDIHDTLAQARANIIMQKSDASEADKLAAIPVLEARGDQDAINALLSASSDDSPAVRAAAAKAAKSIQTVLSYWSGAQNIYYGISLGSVLLLAAIGLSITFGVMGVINMAHGEMIMLGAYTTYVVQQLLISYAPGLMTFSLPIAVPAAFLVAGAAGILLERSVIRFLYGRPLETLLATWGVSLILQQAVRSIFGPTNKPVSSPGWMTGAFDVGHLEITFSRLWIIVFALAVLFALMVFLKRTHFGLQMRAVTQNRKMAAAMGVRTNWVDALTFGLGSGVAGIAGVALSQIDNISPNLGQSYIIDSFMVVVFGGVGNLWGTLVGAMTLGVANKFLEPYTGAVFSKILVLVFIILFIQRRPRGLFALKGRAVEA